MRVAISLVAVLVLVALTGCGGSDEATPTTPEPTSLVPRGLTEADAPGSVDSRILLLKDGPYGRGVELQGPPGTVSEDKAFAIAKTYRDRVADLPES